MSVVSLSGAAVPGSREPDGEIVEKLEELLVAARVGRVHGLGIVVVVDETVTTGWSGKANRHYMLAGAARLQYRMAEDYDTAEQ